MVNAARVMRKLPSLLCNRSTTEKSEWARRHRIEVGLERLKKHNSAKYQTMEFKLILILKDFEKAVLE